jgi:hypothetical protein
MVSGIWSLRNVTPRGDRVSPESLVVFHPSRRARLHSEVTSVLPSWTVSEEVRTAVKKTIRC